MTYDEVVRRSPCLVFLEVHCKDQKVFILHEYSIHPIGGSYRYPVLMVPPCLVKKVLNGNEAFGTKQHIIL